MKNGILILGAASLIIGVISAFNGKLFTLPSNPNMHVRLGWSGMMMMIVGGFLLFFGIKNRKHIK